MREEGYDEGQGYLLGVPQSPEEAFALAHGAANCVGAKASCGGNDLICKVECCPGRVS